MQCFEQNFLRILQVRSIINDYGTTGVETLKY